MSPMGRSWVERLKPGDDHWHAKYPGIEVSLHWSDLDIGLAMENMQQINSSRQKSRSIAL